MRCGWVVRLGPTPTWYRQIVVKPPPWKPPVAWRVEGICPKAETGPRMCIARRPADIKAGPVDPFADIVGRRALALRRWFRIKFACPLGQRGRCRRGGWIFILFIPVILRMSLVLRLLSRQAARSQPTESLDPLALRRPDRLRASRNPLAVAERRSQRQQSLLEL